MRAGGFSRKSTLPQRATFNPRTKGKTGLGHPQKEDEGSEHHIIEPHSTATGPFRQSRLGSTEGTGDELLGVSKENET